MVALGVNWMDEGTSTVVKNLTWPVCPWGIPETLGEETSTEVVDGVIRGEERVIMVPAEVPIQRRSLQAKRAVIRRQAALCCLIISSQVANIRVTAGATSVSRRHS